MKYIVEKKEDTVLSFLLDDAGHAVEIHVDRPADGPKLGDIYIGLVQTVASNINAAFVEILPGMNGYLPFDEIVCPIYTAKGPSPEIQAGDQLVVQITREAFGSKDVSLSTKITLQGKHTVLILGGVGLGVSKKIPEQHRQILKDRILSSEEFEQLQNRAGQCGIVVRTSAGAVLAEPADDGTADEADYMREEILDDIALLEAEMTDIKLKAPYRAVHSVLKKQPPRWISRILHLNALETNEVLTDEDPHNNKILSEELRMSLSSSVTKRNNNVLVIGGSGSGKSFYVVKPNALNLEGSYIFTDPKGEMLRDLGNYLRDNGYNVLVLNLVDMKASDGYNPFAYLRTDSDVIKLITNLINNTTPKNASSSDPFWQHAEELYLQAIMYYVWYEFP